MMLLVGNGLGAVMGSKNLKAIAVRGHKLPSVANEERVKEIRQMQSSRQSPFSLYGTGGPDTVNGEVSGNLPVRNFRDGIFPEIKGITGIAMKETGMRIAMDGCFACPVRCKKVCKVEDPEYRADPEYGGPEYETLAAIGSDCGVGDLKAIARGNALCGAYSLDTISTGSVIAFAMECYERGLLTAKDTGGLELKFGNADAMLKAIEMIAKREGIGDLMAEGTARMAKNIKGSETFALHVKGLEPGMHEPRLKPGLGLCFAIFPTGADHCGGIQDPMVANERMLGGYHPLGFHTAVPPNDLGPRKVALVRIGQFKAIMDDSFVLCSFTGYNLELQADLLKAVTGWDTGIPELLRIGERIITLMRLFNIRKVYLRQMMSYRSGSSSLRRMALFQATSQTRLSSIKLKVLLHPDGLGCQQCPSARKSGGAVYR
jgi:aldehyde:ferredoxin oxidoreductase